MATERLLFAYGGLAVGTAVGLQPSSISIASSHNCENIFGSTTSSSSLSIWYCPSQGCPLARGVVSDKWLWVNSYSIAV